MPRLGDDHRFNEWRGSRSWANGSASFGPDVFKDLFEGVKEYAAEVPGASAIGCVPYFTDKLFARLLSQLDAVCIVLDKGASRMAVAHIEAAQHDFPLDALPGFGGLVTSRGRSDVGPVRLLGVGGQDKNKPLLHAKVLVLGTLVECRFDTGVGEINDCRFEPERAWVGSANWTVQTSSHLEVGLWINDPQFVQDATKFVTTLIEYSEPLTSMAELPSPELRPFEPDFDLWHGGTDSDDFY